MNREAVGIVRAKVRVFSADQGDSKTLELIVDTGSLFSWVPEEMMQSLGLHPSERWKVRPIDGRETERPLCDAAIECEGREGVVPIIFAQPGDFHVLGVTALERLGLEVDPRARVLRKQDATLALALG